MSLRQWRAVGVRVGQPTQSAAQEGRKIAWRKTKTEKEKKKFCTNTRALSGAQSCGSRRKSQMRLCDGKTTRVELWLVSCRMRIGPWLCVMVLTSLVTCDGLMSSKMGSACRLCLLGDRSSCLSCRSLTLRSHYARKRSPVSPPATSVFFLSLSRSLYDTLYRVPTLVTPASLCCEWSGILFSDLKTKQYLA